MDSAMEAPEESSGRKKMGREPTQDSHRRHRQLLGAEKETAKGVWRQAVFGEGGFGGAADRAVGGGEARTRVRKIPLGGVGKPQPSIETRDGIRVRRSLRRRGG